MWHAADDRLEAYSTLLFLFYCDLRDRKKRTFYILRNLCEMDMK
jgi:hypothetical protein